MTNVNAIIKEVWGDAPVTYEPLNGGHVNFTYKVSVDGKDYVLRINGKQNDFLGLSREQEVAVFKAAYNMGIAPPVHPKTTDKYLITTYIEKEEFDFKQPAMLENAVEVLKKIHTIKGINRTFSPFDLVNKYLEGMRSLKVNFPDILINALTKVEEIEKRWNKDRTTREAYCHNDYFTFNILSANKKLYVIDWEISGVGDIFFDLATITFSSAFSRAQEEHLLKCYFGKFEEEHYTALKDMQFMNMLREATWSLMHSGMEEEVINSDINYLDFGNYILSKIKDGYLYY
ncbi:MAG: phosphotransferase family protein [Oscillospiraceae bacterium]|nr:phosphotransferase family protein [Oscillospiraceae bacterium]